MTARASGRGLAAELPTRTNPAAVPSHWMPVCCGSLNRLSGTEYYMTMQSYYPLTRYPRTAGGFQLQQRGLRVMQPEARHWLLDHGAIAGTGDVLFSEAVGVRLLDTVLIVFICMIWLETVCSIWWDAVHLDPGSSVLNVLDLTRCNIGLHSRLTWCGC
jgi:hypothetical protein